METKKKPKLESTVGKKSGSRLLLSPRERGEAALAGGLHRTVIPGENWWAARKEWTKKKK